MTKSSNYFRFRVQLESIDHLVGPAQIDSAQWALFRATSLPTIGQALEKSVRDTITTGKKRHASPFIQARRRALLRVIIDANAFVDAWAARATPDPLIGAPPTTKLLLKVERSVRAFKKASREAEAHLTWSVV